MHGARRAGLLERLPQVRECALRSAGASTCWEEGGVSPSCQTCFDPPISGVS